VKTMSAPKGPHVYDVAGQVIYVKQCDVRNTPVAQDDD
jgi:hypothetical protein